MREGDGILGKGKTKNIWIKFFLFLHGGVFLIVGIAVFIANFASDRFFALLFLGIFGLVGAIEYGIAIGMVVRDKRKRKEREYLKSYGKRALADITDIQPQYNIRINGRNPLILYCRYENPADRKIYLYKSDYLDDNPAIAIDETQVTVYYDPQNPEVYFVDTDALFEKYVLF